MSDDARTVIAYLTPSGDALCVPCSKLDPWLRVGLEPVFEPSDIGDGGYGDDGQDWRWVQCKECGWDVAQFTTDGAKPLAQSGG
jgi:hypothetical protein